MGPVLESKSIFTLDIYFRQYWTDSRLVFNSSKVEELGGSRLKFEDFWIRKNFSFELAVFDVDMETRHLLHERSGLLPAQSGGTKQIYQVTFPASQKTFSQDNDTQGGS